MKHFGAFLFLVACASPSPSPVFDASFITPNTSGADLLLSFSPGMGGDAVDKGTLATGDPDGQPVHLGDGGVLVLGVSLPVLGGDSDGPDVEVVLAGTPDELVDLEAVVYVSVGNADDVFIYTGTITEQARGIDLAMAGITYGSYFRIVATKGNWPIDAVRVLRRAAIGTRTSPSREAAQLEQLATAVARRVQWTPITAPRTSHCTNKTMVSGRSPLRDAWYMDCYSWLSEAQA